MFAAFAKINSKIGSKITQITQFAQEKKDR